jgi:hypothetical protein
MWNIGPSLRIHGGAPLHATFIPQPKARSAASDTCHNPATPGVIGDPQTFQGPRPAGLVRIPRKITGLLGFLSVSWVRRGVAFAATPTPTQKAVLVIRKVQASWRTDRIA